MQLVDQDVDIAAGVVDRRDEVLLLSDGQPDALELNVDDLPVLAAAQHAPRDRDGLAQLTAADRAVDDHVAGLADHRPGHLQLVWGRILVNGELVAASASQEMVRASRGAFSIMSREMRDTFSRTLKRLSSSSS